jgi:A/G-specific adenine glycosylase
MSACELPLSSTQLRSLRRALLRWYDEQRRDLPWRRDRDPYRVWISEIMLQQTRVAAVLNHYTRFMRRFPTVQSLAAAREASVLAVWSGLGYYHRARRMHQAAKIIARERRGEFPHTADEWLKLPGIGRYTSAAIASIAFEQAIAVVDGNVERVLQRLSGPEHRRFDEDAPSLAALETRVTAIAPRVPRSGKPPDLWHPSTKPQSRKDAWRQAEALLDRKRPGDFNQGMMELGATLCTPRAPKCLLCPLNSFCRTRGAGESIASPPRKTKELHYAFARNHKSVLLVRRPADASLMAGMWELPSLTSDQLNGDAPLLRLRHSITSTDYRVAVFSVAAHPLQDTATHSKWFTAQQCERLPLTGLARKILRRMEENPGARLKDRSPRGCEELASATASAVSK